MLKLMYITNNPFVAEIADRNGVDRIFIDMEFIGKQSRQRGRDSVMNLHTPSDIKNIRKVLKNAEILCRVNPIHQAGKDYVSSKEEIDQAIDAGADIIMLPYFKTAEEVAEFTEYVGGRAKTMPLLETPEAFEKADEILSVSGIDEIYIGLNDLSMGYKMKFMFEPLADGKVDILCQKFREKNIPYGFGGIASLGKGLLPSEYVIKEHYRLGSECAILSRSFCNINQTDNINEIAKIFEKGLKEIRNFEKECQKHPKDSAFFAENRKEAVRLIKEISNNI